MFVHPEGQTNCGIMLSNIGVWLLGGWAMAGRWLGAVISGSDVCWVIADVASPNMVVLASDTWKLLAGERPTALNAMYERMQDQAREHKVECAVVKSSAAPPSGGAKDSLLESAELRGVVIAALASVVGNVQLVRGATASKKFGKRTIGEYVKDKSFWDEHVDGQLKQGPKEAAMMIFAAAKQ